MTTTNAAPAAAQQVRAIYSTARAIHGVDEDYIDWLCQMRYGVDSVPHLTYRQADELQGLVLAQCIEECCWE